LKEKGDMAGAIAEYQKAVQIKADYFDAHLQLGVALLHARPDEAVAEFCKAIELKPDSAEAHLNLGDAWHAKRDLPRATAEYREALRLKTDYAEAYYGLGNVYFPDQLDAAIDAYRKATKLDPNDARFHNNLGNSLAVKGALDEAISEFRKAIQLNKNL